jgi:hypothetical protein
VFLGEGKEFFPFAGFQVFGFVFDAPLGDLAVHGGIDFRLGGADFFGDLGSAADDVEGGPGEQGGDGVEVGGLGLAADAGGLEGDGTAAAEGIANAWDAAEAALAEFCYEFGDGGGAGAEVGVDIFPGRG